MRLPATHGGILAVSLILGLAVIAGAAVLLGTVEADVTVGTESRALDRPVARFVATYRNPGMTTLMPAVGTAGGPVAMTVIAL